MDPSAVCCRSNGGQTEASTAGSSQTSGQALLSASNSDTTDPSTPGSTSTTTTLPSNASAGIFMPTASVMPANVTTGTSLPETPSTTTAVPSNASAGIRIPTPSMVPANLETGTSILGSTSTITTLPSDASAGIPRPTPSLMPANVTTGTAMPGTASTTTAVLSNASADIAIPSSTSTPTSFPTNASTVACIPVTASITNTLPSNALVSIPMPINVPVPSRPLAYNELPPEEINRYLNIYAAQVLIPNCYRKILEMGCLKNQTETFYEYIRDTKKLNHSQLKHKYDLSGEDLNKLKHMDPSLMDGPLLLKVIQATCVELKDVSDDVWKENDEGKTECLITILSKCCNKVCHEIKTCATSSEMFDEIVRLLEKLILVGGMLYQQPSTQIDRELNELQQNIGIVRTTKSTREFIALQHLFHTTGYSETERYWENYCTQDIHLFPNVLTTHTDVFYPLDVLPKSSNTQNRSISHEEMFESTGNDYYRPVLILEGEAGSGKSTILKQISMQFFNLTENRMPSLEEFHQLHFLQCNNNQCDNLAAFFMESFPKSCQVVSPEEALRCFPYLGNLILIDGYNEVNKHSVRVTKQFIEVYKTSPACQIVFTARPSAVPDLKDLLRREGVKFNIFQLLGISQEEKQLEFLRPFDRDSGLRQAFSALAPGVKSFLVRPINLIQFCSLFLGSPDKVQKWKSINDVMRDIMSHYETFLTSMLKIHRIPNLKHFIKELFQTLCDFALEMLMKKMFTLNERACAELSDNCFEKINEWGLKRLVDTDHVLSIIFYVTKGTLTEHAVPTYEYSHLSTQELMSAVSLLRDLTLKQTLTLEEIIRTRIENLDERNEDLLTDNDVNIGLLNVYKLVLMIFSGPDKRAHLLRWLPQLEIALTSARADWQDVMMSCDRPVKTEQDEVAKIAAEKTLTASRKWTARTARDVMAIARMLPHAQPDEMNIVLSESEKTPSELATILKMFTGYLRLKIHHSYATYTNCDHIVDELNPSCKVTSLTGCLASSSVSTRSLSLTLQQPGARLYLSLGNPSSHALGELQGTKHILNVRMKHHNPPTARPLPRGFLPPLLIVEDTPNSGAEELRAAIIHYAPEGDVYFSLWLENTLLDNAAIQRLLKALHEAGIRTCYHCRETGFTVASETSDRLCLQCRKTHTDASQRCVWLQLADEREEEGGEEQWPALLDFKAAKALNKNEGQENVGIISSGPLIRFSCFQVITSIFPDTMNRVIDWGCRKPEDMTFLDYILTREGKFKRHFNQTERETLTRTVLPVGSDVTLLYKLIPLVCENLKFSDILPREKASCSTVEGLLWHIKDARNEFAHSTLAVDACLAKLRYFEDLCTKLIIATGKLYAIPMDFVEKEVTTTRCNFFKVMDECIVYSPAARYRSTAA